MQWSEFAPYVMPYVVGVPQPTLELHARLATIEFCRRTLCDTRTLEPLRTDGTALIEMEAEPQTQIIKVKAVAVDGKEWTLVDASQGKSSSRLQLAGDYVFTQDNRTLQLFPVPVAGLLVEVDAALAPSIDASTLPDALGQQFIQDIAHGVVGNIKMIPGQPFSDPAGAERERSLFSARMATIAAKVARGYMNQKMRSHVGYF